MKLSDVMSSANLAIYAEVGLFLFVLAFLGVTIRVLFFGKKEEWNELSRIPLMSENASTSEENRS